ncbi:MAG: helix-turn-helix transcriptional regulator [Rhizobiales bacterium]|nr:helix-turn-helix transcriptional regulator [Hyphomicrobiales bacterium]
MKTRIREFRKERRWTLQDLAKQVGTTAQTVQRLETENMTVSTDWLERFGEAFNIDPVQLLISPDRSNPPILGDIGPDGRLEPAPSGSAKPLSIDPGALVRDAVCVRLGCDCGNFTEGTLLVCERQSGRNIQNAVGIDALAAFSDGDIVFGRVITGEAGRFTIVPLRQLASIWYDRELEWVAPPKLALTIL